MGRGETAACPITRPEVARQIQTELAERAGLHRLLGGSATASRPTIGNMNLHISTSLYIGLHRIVGGGVVADRPVFGNILKGLHRVVVRSVAPT